MSRSQNCIASFFPVMPPVCPNDLISAWEIPNCTSVESSNFETPFAVNKAGKHQSPDWYDMFKAAVSCCELL